MKKIPKQAPTNTIRKRIRLKQAVVDAAKALMGEYPTWEELEAARDLLDKALKELVKHEAKYNPKYGECGWVFE